MGQGWLFTIERWKAPAAPDEEWVLWTTPPTSRRTGEVLRRQDGQPPTPSWGPGDWIVMYRPDWGRCFALLDIIGEPQWRETRLQFQTTTLVRDWDERNGPNLADIGVSRLHQGSRHVLRRLKARVPGCPNQRHATARGPAGQSQSR